MIINIYCDKDLVNIEIDGTFGIIKNEKLKKHLVNLMKDNQLYHLKVNDNTDKRFYLNLLKVVNTLCYKLSETAEMLVEYNPSMNLKSPVDSFWSVDEIEYKLDIHPKESFDFRRFQLIFEEKDIGSFDSGEVATVNSFERYLTLKSTKKDAYLVLLGKKGWNRKPAIKTKISKSGEILTRSVEIFELNKENFIRSVERLTETEYSRVDIKCLPSFYKRKDRVVCIDKEHGFVFGLSYSQAKTIDRTKSCFNQIEVEFWSQIKTYNQTTDFSWPEVEVSHFKLIHDIKSNLAKENFIYSQGERKYEWLSKLGAKKKRFKLEKLI